MKRHTKPEPYRTWRLNWRGMDVSLALDLARDPISNTYVVTANADWSKSDLSDELSRRFGTQASILSERKKEFDTLEEGDQGLDQLVESVRDTVTGVDAFELEEIVHFDPALEINNLIGTYEPDKLRDIISNINEDTLRSKYGAFYQELETYLQAGGEEGGGAVSNRGEAESD